MKASFKLHVSWFSLNLKPETRNVKHAPVTDWT